MLTTLLLPAMLLCASSAQDPIPTQQTPPRRRPSLVRNGNFAVWQEGKPVDWQTTIGARTGDGPASSSRRSQEERALGLVLEGDAATGQWTYVFQRFNAIPGTVYRLDFEARLEGARLDPGQSLSNYVCIRLMDAEGRTVERRIQDVLTPEWTTSSILMRSRLPALAGEVGVFLSRTGKLSVRGVRVEETDETESFELLAQHMDRNYSQFELRGVKWELLTNAYRERAEAAKTPGEFVDVVVEMLGELRDEQVLVIDPEGRRVRTFDRELKRNYDYQAVALELGQRGRQVGQVGMVGRTEDGKGYAALGTFTGDTRSLEELERGILDLFDTPGMLIDVRGNVGGDERWAQRLAGLFTDQRRVYARSRFRSGPGHGDFVEGTPRTIVPRDGVPYTRPVVCLIGPDCRGSGESFAMMMKALPHVTLVGQPTRGTSGNPAPVDLPNGVSVIYSRWLNLLPDGTPIEERGVQPDVPIDPGLLGDMTFLRALDTLRAETR